jgi:hypothetical protein
MKIKENNMICFEKYEIILFDDDFLEILDFE